jgi:branched-chain amino acid transport system ATP-binding protein
VGAEAAVSDAPLLEVQSLTKRFGGFVALDQVSIAVARGERLGLIGPNGSGKTTLINCVSGTLALDAGRVRFDGADISRLPAYRRARLGIARSFQIPRPFRSMTNLDNLVIPLEYAAHRHDGAEIRARAHEILTMVGLAAHADEDCAALSQVELRKLELARALAAGPTLLIVDEVMAGLASSEVDEMLAILARLNADGITIVMIEHIMRAVMAFSQRIAVLDAGRLIADGKPDEVISDPEVEKAYLGE